MRICTVETTHYRTAFKMALKNAHAEYIERQGLFLRLTSDTGTIGFGEIAPLPNFSKETLAESASSLQTVAADLVFENLELSPDKLNESLIKILGSKPMTSSARFGLESAVIDLASKTANLSMARWLNPDCAECVAVNVLLPSDPDKATQALKSHAGNSAIFKFKLSQPWQQASDIVKALSQQLPAGSKLRLDANQNYNFIDAVSLIDSLQGLPIEYLEEPLKNPVLAQIKELQQDACIPLALDESLTDSIDLETVIEQQVVPVIILKPAMLGGVFRTIALAERASLAGLKVVITTILETGIGVTQTLHTALALKQAPAACGLNTLSLLQDSLLVSDPPIRDDHMYANSAGGLGVLLKNEYNWEKL